MQSIHPKHRHVFVFLLKHGDGRVRANGRVDSIVQDLREILGLIWRWLVVNHHHGADHKNCQGGSATPQQAANGPPSCAGWVCPRSSILAVQEVPAEHTRRYGIVAGTQVNDKVMDVSRIVEKPAPESAPSRLGVAGRYILTPGVFHEIANQPRGVGGEIQLTDGIAGLLRREKVFAYRYEGKRYDCGSKEGFLQANVELALQHPDLGKGFREYLKNLEI